MSGFRHNHYVPVWYQERFLPKGGRDRKFYYIDLRPETLVRDGRTYTRKALLRWGPKSCFKEFDLYTTTFGKEVSTEIERRFFGPIDTAGRKAVEYYASFQHPSANEAAFLDLLRCMSVQKLRTPKGMSQLGAFIGAKDKQHTLFELQRLQQMFCAVWTESIWSIADAANSDVKFIVTDHPVTVYNRACFPGSKICRNDSDPDIRFNGTHTIFPLSRSKLLILTNLSWVRDPYGNPLHRRPNPVSFRRAMFSHLDIQTGRRLTTDEVLEINYILKMRARRYIAAPEKQWLYPEKYIATNRWDKFGQGYLLMPDPRSVIFSSGATVGYTDGRAASFDEYGRSPWDSSFRDETRREREWKTFLAFQGEFARRFGPKRRGQSFTLDRLGPEEDDADYHQYHLRLESKYKPSSKKGRKRR